MNDVARLRKTIRDLHGLDSQHVESVPVNETVNGEPVWQGDVEVFAIRGHPNAQRAYAWSYRGDDDTLHHVAVLGVAPINSAIDAVRAAIVTDARKRRQ
ncbi:MAG: hypothetical protein HYR72_05245 [Deltaproteobacteria bacterium]|nr:hypothetical protein [Deltaproteobacteria bacterium]MBI3389706.1 hypothetical protein [Deltaproteobacteria bacterium]